MDARSDSLSAEEARELADRLYRIWNEEGAKGLARELWDPEIVYIEDPSFPGDRVARGRDSAVAHLESVMEGLGDWQATLVEARPFPGGLLTGVRIESTGPASGVPIEGVAYQVGWLRSGRFVEVRTFLQRNDALAAAALNRTGAQD